MSEITCGSFNIYIDVKRIAKTVFVKFLFGFFFLDSSVDIVKCVIFVIK